MKFSAIGNAGCSHRQSGGGGGGVGEVELGRGEREERRLVSSRREIPLTLGHVGVCVCVLSLSVCLCLHDISSSVERAQTNDDRASHAPGQRHCAGRVGARLEDYRCKRARLTKIRHAAAPVHAHYPKGSCLATPLVGWLAAVILGPRQLTSGLSGQSASDVLATTVCALKTV